MLAARRRLATMPLSAPWTLPASACDCGYRHFDMHAMMCRSRRRGRQMYDARATSRGRRMDRIWVVTATTDGCVELTLTTGPPRPLVAAVTETELRSLIEPLRPVDDAVRRNAFSRA